MWTGEVFFCPAGGGRVSHVAARSSRSPFLVQCYAEGELTEVWRFDSAVTTLASSAALLVAGCRDGSVWVWRGKESAEGEAAAKRARVQAHDFCPVAVTPAALAFSRLQEGGNGPVVFATPVGVGSVLCAAGGTLTLCDVTTGSARVVLQRAELVQKAIVLTGTTMSPALADAVAGCSVRETQQSLLLLADASGSLLAAQELASRTAWRDVGKSQGKAAVVFLGATRLQEKKEEEEEEEGSGGRLNAVVAVWSSGDVRVITAEREWTFHAGMAVASGSCWGRVLAVCPSDALAPPVLFDLVPDDLESVPVPRVAAADLPACAAVALQGRRLAGLATAEGRFVQRTLSPLPQLAVSCESERPGEAVREAVQAMASQAVAQAALRERHARANARLSELNGAVAVTAATLEGAVEVRVQDSGALALAVTLKNGAASNLSSEWHLVVAVGKRQLLSSPLPRGVRAGASASVVLGPLVPDSHAAMTVKVWLMHLSAPESSVGGGGAATRFAVGSDLALALCERRVSPLELCWERRGFVRTFFAPPPRTRCPLHSSPPPPPPASSSLSASRSSRLLVNSEYATQGGVVSATYDSAFGSVLSVQVKPGPAPGLSEVAVACGGSAAEAAAARAAVVAKLLAGVAAESRRSGNDWRTVRAPLAALLQRLEACSDAELAAVYADLRRLQAKIL